MKPTFFTSPARLRQWLEKKGGRASELWIGFHKKASGMGGITYPEALDEALCFGWIDGVRKSLDEARFTIRFTPRRAKKSYWSLVNLRRARELKALGRMARPGLEAFAAPERKKGQYSYENRPRTLPSPYRARFEANAKAWAFFEAQPPGYRRTAIWFVVSAAREETRQKRLAILIEESDQGRRLGMLARPQAKGTKK